MNLIAAVFGQPDFSQLVNFLLVALAVFLIVKVVNRAMRRPSAKEPSVRECPFCLTGIPARATRCSGCTMEVQPVTGG